MENQPKLNSSKEVIAFLAERFPQCFSAEGEARPLKIGIFQDLVERVGGEMNLSKTQLRAALRLYTSSWRYLYGVKPALFALTWMAIRAANWKSSTLPMRVSSWKKRARVQAQRAAQQAKKREAAAAAGQQDEGVRRERKPRPQQPRRKEGAEQRKPRPVAAKAPREERLTPVSDVSVLTVGQALKVKAGNNAMDATVLEITKDGVRVQLTSGMSMIVRAEHLVF